MRALIIVLVLEVVLVRCGTSHAEDLEADDDVVLDDGRMFDDGRMLLAERGRIAASAPPVADVVAAAVRAQGLGGDPARGAARRARLAGLVPLVSVRAGNTASWRDAEADVGRGASLEVRATWRLDRLVFDGRELQAQAMSTARRREKRRVAARVIRAYFIWKRAAMAGAVVRREEAEAELDALTDGWFSEARRSASEVRTVGPPP